VKRRKPRILLLADKRGWAHDHNARQIIRWLKKEFAFDLRYVRESPRLRPSDYDLIYVFFWGEDYHKQFDFDPERVLKGLSSHRWEDDPQYGPHSPATMAARYLTDAGAVVCPSLRLHNLFRDVYPRLYHAPKGYDPKRFRLAGKRSGPMTIGWAGNIGDAVKRFRELLEPACRNRFQLITAPGDLSHRQMNRFYNRVDVFALSSRHEGDPLTLIEAMAAGCFPVCNDVGIVPELVRSGENGLIVEATPEAFRQAFEWCESHLDQVRQIGVRNGEQMIRQRRWELTAAAYASAFRETLANAQRPRFRNDDVSWDTALDSFRRFCAIFQKYGLTQVHGVTLRGRTNTPFQFNGDAVAYKDTPSLSKLSNDRIRKISEGLRFEDRRDLVAFLQAAPDEIALHGLYHTDYSQMTADEQRRDIGTGLVMLQQLFPKKLIRYFVAPFNRTSRDTVAVCREFGLTVLAANGIHLEEELGTLRIRPGVWHRYHHHRFYPETAFTCYKLSLEALDAAFARNFSEQMRTQFITP
jgi:hypothetical protein